MNEEFSNLAKKIASEKGCSFKEALGLAFKQNPSLFNSEIKADPVSVLANKIAYDENLDYVGGLRRAYEQHPELF